MNAIEANNLTKVYRFYKSPKDRLREILSPKGKKFHEKFFALNGISLTVEKGQTVGIIGQNGSGKSTLLKIICGVLQPTTGDIHVNGRISALLELGAGFNPEFTGRENVYMNGSLLGLSKEEIDKRFPEIEAFAEIGEFIDQPVKTYSNGMFVRLAFSAAANIDPDILVVDEALSVGDMFFQHKCISKMDSFQKSGKTILLVAHDINMIKNFCNTVFLLNDGKILDSGDPEYVTEQYLMLIRQKQTKYASSMFKVTQKTLSSLPQAKINFGSEAGQILEVSTLDKDLNETSAFLAGTTIVIRVKVQIDPSVKKPSITFLVRDERAYNVYGADTENLKLHLKLNENNQATAFFVLSPILRAGSYSLVVALNEFYTSKVNMLLDKQVGVAPFYVIENKSKFLGVVDLQAKAFQDPSGFLEKSG
jgi:ABC-type polysaccharide/polyol phosphate transport system ATPase subunit